MKHDVVPEMQKTEQEWRALLTPDQYHILREAGTEAPGTGELLANHRTGTYLCGACGFELFASDAKYDSHCGWPSFTRPE
ncbi:MAG: peptide-methionine (R)-S-oxide reductase, partial [Candidatus Eremiobacteraeota bacterium]|nr:peptide-methionine (R)-S-oxide reductase [Candidatus Eremiobacteraeota bacterium]